jgi:hypothetical protein
MVFTAFIWQISDRQLPLSSIRAGLGEPTTLRAAAEPSRSHVSANFASQVLESIEFDNLNQPAKRARLLARDCSRLMDPVSQQLIHSTKRNWLYHHIYSGREKKDDDIVAKRKPTIKTNKRT